MDRKIRTGIIILIVVIAIYLLAIQELSGISGAIIIGLAIGSGMVLSGAFDKRKN